MSSILTLSRRLLVVLAAALMLSTSARAEPTIGETGEPVARASAVTAAAPKAGSVRVANCDTGSARVFIDINNATGPLYNIGGLFWRANPDFSYEIPAGTGIKSLYATGVWVGGLYDGNPADLRFAGSTYAPWEFWPGPLGADGDITQSECASFDQFWKVNKQEIINYVGGAAPTAALSSWPIAQGAPFYVDANGNSQRDPGTEPRIEYDITDAEYSATLGAGRTINLQAGERPDIIGDQGIWWVMNDVGNTHGWSGKAPIGLEARVLAFGFKTADALNNTTFYRYQFFYRNDAPLQETYLGFFSDPDLGDYQDDYVGSDIDLGLGFVYNGDTFDAPAGGGYGPFPPALGYDYFQGPLVNDDGIDNNGNGTIDEEDERLQVETFFYFTNAGGPTSDPTSTDDRGKVSYQYMQGVWKDGVPMTVGGNGYNPGSTELTRFAFTGDPPAFWSEYNTDGLGTSTEPADRRFGIASGPFTFDPDDKQELVFGIVWSSAPEACASTATPQIASLAQLKFDDITVQGAFNADFVLPSPPSAVNVTATPLDQEIVLDFTPINGTFFDLFNYEVDSPFAEAGAPDATYNFEGIRIIQYRDAQDQTGTVVATYDLNNSVTTVVDTRLDCSTGALVTGVVATGNNSGTDTTIPTSISITSDIYTSGGPLRNNTTYYFGVQPYAYNEFSSPSRVFSAPLTRVEVRPSIVAARGDGTVIQSSTGDLLQGEPSATTAGGGVVQARIVNPGALTGESYRVEFFTQMDATNHEVGTNYRIVNTTTGQVLLDGAQYYASRGTVLPQTTDVFRVDGLAFDVSGPAPEVLGIVEVNAAGEVIDTNLLNSLNSPSTRPPIYLVGAQGAAANNASGIISRLDFNGFLLAAVPREYEVRWVEPSQGQAILDRAYSEATPFMTCYETGTVGTTAPYPVEGVTEVAAPVVGGLPRMPFQLWEIDPDGTERQVHAAILEDADDQCYGFSTGATVATGNPYSNTVYERIYGTRVPYVESELTTPAGRADVFSRVSVLSNENQAFGRLQVVFYDGPAGPPQPGTGIRMVTSKPNLPGDVYTVNTADVMRLEGQTATAESALDLISITPNPYRGSSGYEQSGDDHIARFVNLPSSATIRVFTLSGTLVRTLNKANDGNTTLDWDLTTQAGLPAASGIYLIHVEGRRADGTVIGERILKFGLVQRRIQLDFI